MSKKFGVVTLIARMNFAVPAYTLTVLPNKTTKMMKLASLSLCCKSYPFKTAIIKMLFINSKHRS